MSQYSYDQSTHTANNSFKAVCDDVLRLDNSTLPAYIHHRSMDESEHAYNCVKLMISAVKSGNLDAVKMLTRAGIGINEKDELDRALVHYVWESNSIDMLNALIEMGADVNLKNHADITPLRTFASSGWEPGVKRLIEMRVDLDVIDKHNSLTPLMAACVSKNSTPGVIRALLEAGADMRFSNENGMDAIRCAITHNNYTALDILLDHGAVMCGHPHQSSSMLHYAVKQGAAKVINALGRRGHDLDELDKNGCTALHVACRFGSVAAHGEIVKEFIAGGASLDIKDHDGMLALDYLESSADRGLLAIYQQAERELIGRKVSDGFDGDAPRKVLRKL